MPDNSQLLYNGLKEQGLYTKSYQDFTTQFSTPEARQSLYEGMNQKGLYTKSAEDFNAQFFSVPVEKKNLGTTTTPPSNNGTPPVSEPTQSGSTGSKPKVQGLGGLFTQGQSFKSKDELQSQQSDSFVNKTSTDYQGVGGSTYTPEVDPSKVPIDKSNGKSWIDTDGNLIKNENGVHYSKRVATESDLKSFPREQKAPQNKQPTVTPQNNLEQVQPISHDDLVNALGGLKNKSDFSPQQLEVKQQQNDKFSKLGAATSPERNNKDIQDALVKLNQNPNDDNAIYQLGYGNLTTGNTEGAQSLFTQALQINPDNYKAKMGLGYVDFKNGNYESALQSFQSAMPNIPENVTLADGKQYKNPDYQQNILQIAQNQTLLSKTKPELLPDAEKSVDYVLSQSPNDVLATQLKSQIEKQKGNIDASKELDNKAVSDYVAQSPAPTMFSLEQQWIKDHPKETRSFGQAWMDAHADLESKWGKVGADVLDPLGLVVGNVQAIGEGLKDMKDGLDKMQPKSLIESGNMTKKYFEGLTQTLKGGATATFAGAMTSPTGFAFDLATDAGDLVSNGYASKIIMSPLQSFMPKTDDALTNNLYNIGDVIINGIALGALHEGVKSPEVKKAYDKLKDGKDLKPTEVKLLNETVQENATPENLQKISDGYSKLNTKEVGSNANEVIADYVNIPDETKNQIPQNISTEKSVELAPLLEKYDAKKKELDSANETLKEPIKLQLEKIQEQIQEVIKAPNKDYELDATNKSEPIELTITPKTETDAIQKQSTGEMDVRQPSQNGEAMGEGNTQSEGTPQQGQPQNEQQVGQTNEVTTQTFEQLSDISKTRAKNKFYKNLPEQSRETVKFIHENWGGIKEKLQKEKLLKIDCP